MAWWNFLNKSDKIVDTGLDLIKMGANGLDMLFFTDEERSIRSGEIMSQAIEMNKATADENSVRSKTRRFLAKAIIINYLVLVNASALFACFKQTDLAKFLFKIANETLGSHVLAVVIFYFGYYGIKAIVKQAKE